MMKTARSSPNDEVETVRKELMDRQNPDGGWPQLPGGKSDAYATGQAMYALRNSGESENSDAITRATGFLVRQYFLFNRTTWMDETIEHTGKAILGLTTNCAKCHDHKYDPIRADDYYRLRSIFEPYQVRYDAPSGSTDPMAGFPRAFDNNLAAVEEMPRNSRAYALSVLALAAGFGAGVAVAALKFADLGRNGWRLVYVMSLMWLPVAVVLMRRLEETRRFTTRHQIAPPLQRRRLALVAAVALSANLFVAPASYFQNRYLDDVRGFSGGGIAAFVLLTGTPASMGLVVGGRIADVVGRRVLIAVCTPLSTALLVSAFFTSGPLLWIVTLAGGFLAAVAYPAYAVYRSELFPTGNRGRANGLVTTVSLLSGSVGIFAVGLARTHGASFGAVMAVMGVGQLVAAWLAFRHYPETAHLELEQLNPEDPSVADA